KKKRRSIGRRPKKAIHTSQETGEKRQMFEQSALHDFGDRIGFVNTIEQNDVGGETIEPIDFVSTTCIGDSVANNDK
ncbi:hypothetical protein HAX54_027826, partial [Datura stramonium]|nr:hypothetical protein [Datura stramonium]